MPETFERGKKYQVIKSWSREPVPGVTTWRFSVDVGELLRFIGPNWDGAYFRDASGKTIVLPVKVAFKILEQPNKSLNADGRESPAKSGGSDKSPVAG